MTGLACYPYGPRIQCACDSVGRTLHCLPVMRSSSSLSSPSSSSSSSSSSWTLSSLSSSRTSWSPVWKEERGRRVKLVGTLLLGNAFLNLNSQDHKWDDDDYWWWYLKMMMMKMMTRLTMTLLMLPGGRWVVKSGWQENRGETSFLPRMLKFGEKIGREGLRTVHFGEKIW